MVSYPPHGYLVTAVPYVKLYVNEPRKKYTSGDVVSGFIEFKFPFDFTSELKSTHWACNVVLQLRCALKLDLGKDAKVNTIEYERRMKVLVSKSPLNIMTMGYHVVPFQFKVDVALNQQPPTLALRAAGGADNGFQWSLAAWIEGENNKGYVEVNHRIMNRQIIELYPRSDYQVVKDLFLDKKLTNENGFHGCTVEFSKLAAYLPQSPDTFHLKLAIKPSRSVFIYGFDFELEMKLTLVAGKKIVVHKQTEKVGSIIYNNSVNSETVLAAAGCVISTHRPQNICTANVKLEHTLLVICREQKTVLYQIPVDVSLPTPSAIESIGETQDLWSNVMSWCGSLLSSGFSGISLY